MKAHGLRKAVLFVALASCASEPTPAERGYACDDRIDFARPSAEALSRCMARPDVRAYLADLGGRVQAKWRIPPASSGKATVRFVLSPDGALIKGCAAGAPSYPLAVSAGAALFEAAPFPPLAGEARCAAGPLLALTLAVPANQASSPDEAPGHVR